MAAALSSVIVEMKANAGKLRSGVQEAKGLFKSIEHAALSAGVKLEILKAGFNALTGVIASGIATVKGFIDDQFEFIDVVAKASDSLGLSTETLTAWMHAGNLAGASQELLTSSLQKLQKNIGDGQRGIGTASEAVEALGLRFQDFSKLPLEEQFKQVADGISNLSNESARASVATQLFGRQGQELLPLLSAGSAALDDQKAKIEALGLSFDRFDASQVEAFNDSVTDLKFRFELLAQELVTKLAPYLSLITTEITEFVDSTIGGSDLVGKSLKGVIGFIGHVADVLEVMKMIGKAAFIGLEFASLGILASLQLLADAIVKLGSWFGRDFDNSFFEGIRNGVKNLKNEITEDIEELNQAWLEPPPSQKINQAVQSFERQIEDARQKFNEDRAKKKENAIAIALPSKEETKRIEDIGKMLDSMRDKVSNFGKTQSEIDLDKLIKLGATEDQIQQFKAEAEKLKGLELDKKLGDRAKELTEDLQTPIDKFKEQREELNKLLEKGLITQEQFRKLDAKNAQDVLGNRPGDVEAAKSGVIERGSAAAFSILNRQEKSSLEQKSYDEMLTQSGLLDKLILAVKENNATTVNF